MGLLVQKYGGTSVGSPERIAAVAQRVSRAVANGDKIVVVVSAMSGETNRLVDLTNQFGGQPNEMHRDLVLATGEQVTVGLLCIALEKIGITAKGMLGWQVPVLTDNAHSKARIQNISGAHIEAVFEDHQVCVIAGFQGVTGQGDVATLGRGGSDTSAVAIAAAINADECQIYTDVDGVFTTDPRICENARLLNQVSFDEMLELSSSGAKVLQLRAVEYASKHNMPIRVLSSFSDSKGTLVEEREEMERPVVSGISSVDSEAKLTIRGVPDLPGIAAKILGPISDSGIDIDVIVQNISDENTTDFTFTVDKKDTSEAEKILQKTSESLGGGLIEVDDDIAKVSIVGRGMRGQSGIASKMFQSLADHEINILMITTSEIKISVVIKKDLMKKAVNALHDTFELDKNLDN
ncbi:MAG: aspartate kinase [Chloroflexi bacterium]|nr:aspartate kinase [Chloroflexota bacterium]